MCRSHLDIPCVSLSLTPVHRYVILIGQDSFQLLLGHLLNDRLMYDGRWRRRGRCLATAGLGAGTLNESRPATEGKQQETAEQHSRRRDGRLEPRGDHGAAPFVIVATACVCVCGALWGDRSRCVKGAPQCECEGLCACARSIWMPRLIRTCESPARN